MSAAVNEYVRQFGMPSGMESAEDSAERQTGGREIPIPDAPVVVPQTYKPTGRAKKKKRRVLYGEPIGFRGLRYAPVNEQGVVYLFGLVSRELGFYIESIRTEFPDCEGKRCLNRDCTKLERVRIEFEYKSTKFLEHGHGPDGCDLVVCWQHDWDDCPLEVLELKSTIPLLPND